MLYFSSLLKTNPKYSLSAENLFSALSDSGEEFALFDGAKDIWARDYMPVRTKGGKYISFRYEPSYLADDPQLRTNYKADIGRILICRLHTQISILTAETLYFRRQGRKPLSPTGCFRKIPNMIKILF